jgi:hypothetical protein
MELVVTVVQDAEQQAFDLQARESFVLIFSSSDIFLV